MANLQTAVAAMSNATVAMLIATDGRHVSRTAIQNSNKFGIKTGSNPAHNTDKGRAPSSLPHRKAKSPPLRSCSRAEPHTREKPTMAKEELLEFDGTVTEELPDGNFRVKLDNEHLILAYTAGKMRKFRIRTGVGDRVIVEMSPYDLARGRITFRHKSAQPTTAATGQRRAMWRKRG